LADFLPVPLPVAPVFAGYWKVGLKRSAAGGLFSATASSPKPIKIGIRQFA